MGRARAKLDVQIARSRLARVRKAILKQWAHMSGPDGRVLLLLHDTARIIDEIARAVDTMLNEPAPTPRATKKGKR